MEQRERITLLALPPEIQTKVLSHLPLSFSNSTIQAVLRTCKQLYEVALPLSVCVFRNTVQYPKDQGPCSRARNSQFLRYILISKPWLAKHVKTLILGRFSMVNRDEIDPEEAACGNNWVGDRNPTTEEQLDIYQQYIEMILGQLLLDEASLWSTSWVEDLKNGTTDAQVALITLACPNIRAFLFEASSSRHFIRLLKMAGSMSSECASLHDPARPKMHIPLVHLQDVFHEERDYSNGDRCFYLEASELFTLPRLRFYECLGPKGMDDAAASFKRLPRRSSPVEEVTLHGAWYTAHMLWSMLGACRVIRKFEFNFHKPDFIEQVDTMMPRDILYGLLPHADTLEHLYLNLQEDWDHRWDWHHCPERLYMGAELRDLYALKTLTVGMQALTGMLAAEPNGHNTMPLQVEGAPRIIDCLPESLEYLTIHSCGPAILDQVEELVQEVMQGNRLKHLNSITVLHHAWRVDLQAVKSYMASHPGLMANQGMNNSVRVDIGFQSQQAFYHDLCPNFFDCSNQLINCTSRIYAPNFRRQYLERRMNMRYVDGKNTYNMDPTVFEE